MEVSPELFAVSGVLNAAVALFYGTMVLLKSRRDAVVRFYYLMTVAIALWGVAYWQWLLATTLHDAYWWLIALTVGSLFIPVFFLHWVVALIGQNSKDTTWALFTAYGVAICSSVFVGTEWVIAGIGPQLIFPYWPQAGPVYVIATVLLYVLVPLYASFLVIRARARSVDQDERAVYLYLLIGSAIGFGGGLTNFPLWYDIHMYPYGSFLVALFPLIFGYASFRHQLFTIKLVSAELLVFFMLAVLFLQVVVSETPLEVLFRSAFLAVVCIFSWFLIASVYKEIENREQGERLARYLANANARLRELDRQKTEFVSVASHQLRSPVAAIMGYTSNMSEGLYGKVPKELHLPIERILDSGRRVSLIIDDFLNVTRIEQGHMSYSSEPHDICTLVSEATADMQVLAEHKGLKLTVKTPKHPVMVVADEGKLKQVISNLVDNSIKYTQKGAITVRVTENETDGKVQISVSDTGIGVEEKDVRNLFQKFSRASNANKSSVQGTGLGLYIAREMVKAHSGTITVQSEGPDKGTTFVVTLPLANTVKDVSRESNRSM